MRLIVEGSPVDIQFVTSICRDKVRRGQLTLTPAAEAEAEADDSVIDISDSKYTEANDEKAPKKRRVKKTE